MTKAHPEEVTKLRCWRWRSNPLRRRSDVTEAWIVLAVWAFALLGGLVTGQVTAMSLERTLDARRAEVRPVSAVVTQDAPRTPASARFVSTGDTVWVGVRWTTADGGTQVGRTKAEPGTAEGARVTVWTDRTGAIASEPLTATEARLQSVLAGTLAALGSAAVALVCGRLVRGSLLRRRMAEWEAEWRRVGPRWRKRMIG